MIVWAGVGVLFLLFEGFALATKERHTPTLSRTIWRLTAWQVRVRGRTLRPLRVLLFVFMAWLTIHLSFGECALGLCL